MTFRVVKNNRVEADPHDDLAKPFIAGLTDEGIWSRKLERNVFMDSDGDDFLEAIEDSVSNSSFWQAVADTPTPTDMPIYAVSHN